MTREAEQREIRLRDDMKKLRSQQEQTLGTLDTKIEAMMKRRTQAIMDRLEGLLGNRSESRSRQATSGEPNREPRVNFNEQANRRRIYGSTRSSCSSSSYATGDNRPRGLNIRGGSNGNRPTSNERTMQNANAGLQNARLGDVIVQIGVMRIKEEIVPATRTRGKIRSSYRRAMTLERGIHELRRQWLQRLNL